jgi:hypothetical protein
MYAEEDPSKVIFETSTRLKLESNRWMLIALRALLLARVPCELANRLLPLCGLSVHQRTSPGIPYRPT